MKKVQKKKQMKKNGFINGAFIATLGIVITKIIGMLYVIPFFSFINLIISSVNFLNKSSFL